MSGYTCPRLAPWQTGIKSRMKLKLINLWIVGASRVFNIQAPFRGIEIDSLADSANVGITDPFESCTCTCTSLVLVVAWLTRNHSMTRQAPRYLASSFTDGRLVAWHNQCRTVATIDTHCALDCAISIISICRQSVSNSVCILYTCSVYNEAPFKHGSLAEIHRP